MGTLVKLIMALWPFLREMIIKDKESQQFVERNKHTLYIAAAAAMLFLLFCNAFIKNIQFSQMIVEERKNSEYYKERYESSLAAMTELKAEHNKVRKALFTCVGIPELMMAEEPKLQKDEGPAPVPKQDDRTPLIIPNQFDRKRLDLKESDDLP